MMVMPGKKHGLAVRLLEVDVRRPPEDPKRTKPDSVEAGQSQAGGDDAPRSKAPTTDAKRLLMAEELHRK